MKRKRKRKKRILKKTFNILFFTTIIGFTFFSYLFVTRVTTNDVRFFIEQTKDNTSKIIKNIKQYHETKISKKQSKSAIDETKKNYNQHEIVQKSTQENKTKSELSNFIYYSQIDEQWKDKIYGDDDTIGIYGCGPTTLAMVISNLTDNKIKPDTMAKWAYDNGFFCSNSGSYHSIIPDGAQKHGLVSKSLEMPTKQTILDELSKGNLIVVLMNKGTFTSDGHFIILREIVNDSQVLIADSKNIENSKHPWDIDLILKEAKYYANNGGPFWSIGKE